jgi:DNA adenine methylase
MYSRDYSETFKIANKYDVIYADPPYWNTYSGYTGTGFGDEQHLKLASLANKAHKRGAKVILSNIDCTNIREAYGSWTSIRIVQLKHQIGAKTESRRKANEVIITT